ncbi:cell wall metabolism sensor histidine kinase WalK [Reichenbachiella sp. MSK19-1]|uniref:sensor histidine kinase n=1 Tax=Reichenbachiella sp. MSK19-1 TaxID=1897631 RepID=UPI000E6D5666|nr:HAMP domain-containing sensor histidine kinase [Reichenbachiella sp. MSK19-1]RJE74543.1 two-component sensor histidine kinase [Reichenbachiella sp. MSK19-1]
MKNKQTKLLHQSNRYLSLSILLIVSIWSVIFYFSMLDEIYDSIDDGLDNYKLLILQKAEIDSTVLHKNDFDESNYAIIEITKTRALATHDIHKDTLLYMQFEDDLEPVRLLTTAFQLKDHYYQLKVISSMVEEDDLIADLFWSIVFLYIALVSSIIWINNIVLKKLWQPFYKILTQLKHFRLDRARPLTPIPTQTTEFNELKDTADALVQHTLETYHHQKQFTENASHELQTPLAIVTTKLELLLERGDLKEGNADHIAQVLQIIERLTRLNKSLLLLAKIENKQFYAHETVDFHAIALQCIQDLEDIANFKEVQINLSISEELTVEMDATLANILLTNLIKNAIFHNHPGGKVELQLSNNSLRISNTGSEKALNTDKIFNRFHKESDAHSNTGLGLALVKAICQLYHYPVNYHYEGHQHIFEVKCKK